MARIGMRLSAEHLAELENTRASLKKERRFDEALRLRVIVLAGSGITMQETARICEVGMTTVKRWIGRFRSGGITSLLTKGPYRGKKPKLSHDQLQELAQIIETGPEAHGLETGVWTSPIIADLVYRRFGVRYHPSQVRRILHKLGFSIQYPRRQLSLADQALQRQWILYQLPAIKKSPHGARSDPVRG